MALPGKKEAGPLYQITEFLVLKKNSVIPSALAVVELLSF